MDGLTQVKLEDDHPDDASVGKKCKELFLKANTRRIS